jgi:hypothetical protein
MQPSESSEPSSAIVSPLSSRSASPQRTGSWSFYYYFDKYNSCEPISCIHFQRARLSGDDAVTRPAIHRKQHSHF